MVRGAVVGGAASYDAIEAIDPIDAIVEACGVPGWWGAGWIGSKGCLGGRPGAEGVES